MRACLLSLFSVCIGVTVAAAQVKGYTACGDHVLKFDATDGAILSDISGFFAVGPGATAATISHDGRFAYVTNQLANTVGKYDTTTPTITDSIIVGNGPVGVDVMPGDTRLLVTLALSNVVAVADIATRTIVKSIPVSGSRPVIVVIEPHGQFAYVGYEASAMVSVIDLRTLTETATIPAGFGTVGIAFTPAGDKAYVTGAFSNTVSVINTASAFVEKTLTGFDGPVGVAVTPDGTEVWIANHGAETLPPFSSKISVYNTATDVPLTTLDYFQFVQQPNWIAFTPDGKQAFVTMQGIPEVQVGTGTFSMAVFSVATHQPSRDIAVPPFGCSGIAIQHPSTLQVLITDLETAVEALNVNPKLKSLLLAYISHLPTTLSSLNAQQRFVLATQIDQSINVVQRLAIVGVIPKLQASQLVLFLREFVNVLTA